MKFSEAINDCIESLRVSGLNPAEKDRAEIFLRLMEEVGETLLRERKKHREQVAGSHEPTRPVDLIITELINERLVPLNVCGMLCSEDKESSLIYSDPMLAGKIVLTDAVDNTKAYVDVERDDFGSSLIGFDKTPGEVFISVFILPAKNRVFCALGKNRAWMNGTRLVSLTVRTPPLIKQINIRRPRNNTASLEILELYEQAETRSRKEHFDVSTGPDLTALNALSMAEGHGPTRFLYYAKPWDILPAAFIAWAVGAHVIDAKNSAPIFPLGQGLISKIGLTISEKKELEQAGKLRDLYLIHWPE